VSDLELARHKLLVAAQSLAQRRHGHKRSGGQKLLSLTMVRQHFDSQLFAKESQEWICHGGTESREDGSSYPHPRGFVKM
jgi:hypothetical protein